MVTTENEAVSFLDEKKTEEIIEPTAWFTVKKLFSYTNYFERCIFFCGILAACGAGFGIPLMAALLGNVGQTFIDITRALQNDTSSSMDKEVAMQKFTESMIFNCSIYLALGLWSTVTNWTFRASIYYVSECMINRFRIAFMKHILTSDAVYFDKIQTGQFSVLLNYHIERIREGTHDQLGYLIKTAIESSLAMIIAFSTDWKLATISSLMIPILIILSTIVYKLSNDSHEKKAQECEKAGAVAAQALSNIRTVIAFNGQWKELAEYRKYLKNARTHCLKYRSLSRLIGAFSIFTMYFIEFVAYYYGAKYVYENKFSGGRVVRVLFAVFFASQCFKEGGRTFTEIGISVVSAKRLVRWMQQKSQIEGEISQNPTSPRISEGRIEFSNVHFSYPTRSSIKVLKGINFYVNAGEKLAIVGASGSGKTSIVQLLMRHYELDCGTIKIDDCELKDFDLNYLRSKIGIVSQEPVLFGGTIEENILFAKPSATSIEINEALRKANAYDFVMSFPKGTKTLVGERGAQLSGGQKQRIAIARALIRNPEIMLFDEATSSLDSENESIVQKALENACKDKTTITIAHRLSTIKNSDRILVVNEGEIVEIGTHQELISRKGEYFEMIQAQVLMENVEKEEDVLIFDDEILASQQLPMATDKTLHKQFSNTSTNQVGEQMEGEIDRLKRELEEEGATKGTLWQLISYSKREMWLAFIGCTIGAIHGLCKPAFAYSYTQILAAYSKSGIEILELGRHWAWILLYIGLVDTICTISMRFIFVTVGENIVLRLQTDCFRHLLRLPCAYFDDALHCSARLSTRLAADAANARWGMDYTLGHLCGTFTGFTLALIVATIYGWRMAILTVTTFPLIMYGKHKLGAYLKTVYHKDRKALEAASRLAMESIDNIKTVRCLTMENSIIEKYTILTGVSYSESLKRAKIQAFVFAITSSAIYFVYCVNYAFGAYLVSEGIMLPFDVYIVLFCIAEIMCNCDISVNYFPDYVKAIYAIGLINKLLDEKSTIDNLSTAGLKPDETSELSLENVEFSYPQRADQTVLKNISFLFPSGKTTALIGPSGCGKSSMISLIERFYDPNSGFLNLGKTNLTQIQPRFLHSRLCPVPQQSTLFNRTIRENIIYGLESDVIISDERIFEVLQQANIKDFIESLPEGIETTIGERGAQLSGGQKQRIAIARALIRNPDILLLDEATSNLDSQNETLVQAALDKASATRTTIIVAHRLSTVANAQKIVVMNNGEIIEEGSPSELLKKKGNYWSMMQRHSELMNKKTQ